MVNSDIFDKYIIYPFASKIWKTKNCEQDYFVWWINSQWHLC